MKTRRLTARGLAVACMLTVALTASEVAAKESIRVDQMQKYCQGEASAAFGQRPQDILTLPPEERDNGAHSVYGQYPPSGSKVTTFECRFTPKNHFNFVKKTGKEHNKSDEASTKASGRIRCQMGDHEPKGYCPFTVNRQGDGTAQVKISKPNTQTRTIFFKNGKATGYDMSQARPGEFQASKQGDTYVVHINEELYELPEAVIYGG